MGKIKFKLNTDKEKALEYLRTQKAPFIEPRIAENSNKADIYMMREYQGVRFAEFVYEAEITDNCLTGKIKRPFESTNKPSKFGTFIIVFVSLLLLAAIFGAIYFCALLIARNFLYSLYIALPIFALAAGSILIAVIYTRRKRHQYLALKAYLKPIIVEKDKKLEKIAK